MQTRKLFRGKSLSETFSDEKEKAKPSVIRPGESALRAAG